MTIKAGQEWGALGSLPDGAPIAGSDEELGSIVVKLCQARRGQRTSEAPMGPVGLTGGSLWRTMGASSGGADRLASEALVAPVDVGRVLLDGTIHWFVSHLVARSGWARGRILGLMNSEFLGDWDVATRSHPNDGRLDLFDSNLSLTDRWKAKRRLPTGGHVPHPGIETRRLKAYQTEFDPPLDVYLDGVVHRQVRTMTVAVEPDALIVVA